MLAIGRALCAPHHLILAGPGLQAFDMMRGALC